MNTIIFTLLTVLAYFANSVLADVTFRVICSPNDYGGTGVTIYIDGSPFPMTSPNNDIIYEYTFNGVPKNYYYEITGVPAQNELTLFGSPRTWDPNSTVTFYEIFGRPITVRDDIIQTIPRLYPPIEGYDKFSQLFQEGEVPVIHVHMTQIDYNTLISLTANREGLKFTTEVDLITPYEKYHFTNASLSLSGQGSLTREKKPYKIELSGDKTDEANSKIFKRTQFKLRSLRFDTSYIKNKLASEIAESLGLPVTQNIICRLYINNKSYGLYELSDFYKKKFIERFFNPETNGEEYVYGSLYKASSGLDKCNQNFPVFLFNEPPEVIQSKFETIVTPTQGYDPYQDVMGLIQWFDKLPLTATKAQIEEHFDLDLFLKYAAIEHLICHWDGHLGNGNNYLVYVEPNNGKYHIFSYDFDMTFGRYCPSLKTNSLGNIDVYVNSVTSDSYDCGPKKLPLSYTKIINNPEIKPIFTDLIKDILENLFNMEALGPRIKYFHDFLKYDMYWDVFSYKIIETKHFNQPEELPTVQRIENEYSENGEAEDLVPFIKNWSAALGQAYGVTTFKSDPRHGTVGGKMITLGKAESDPAGSTDSSGVTTNTKYSFTILFTMISMIFMWIIC